MISPKMSIAIGVVLLIVFGSMAYITIEKSSSSSSLTSSTAGGYAKIVNGTGVRNLYVVNDSSTSISLNFTLYTNSNQVYIYDISPLSSNHNSSLNTINLTYLNKSQYPYNYILDNNTANGTVFNLTLYLNPAALDKMNVTTNPADPQVYVVEILAINGKDGSAGFGFGVIKKPS